MGQAQTTAPRAHGDLRPNLRLRRSKTPHFRSSEPEDRRPPNFDLPTPKIEEPLSSSIFDLRSRRPKNPHLRSSAPKNGSKIGREMGGGVRLLRRWAGSSKMRGFFDLMVPKNKEHPSSTFSARGTKNPPSSTFSAERTKNPHPLVLLLRAVPSLRPMATSPSQLS